MKENSNTTMLKSLILMILIAFIASSRVSAQNCAGYDNKCAKPKDGEFTKSNISRSVSVKQKLRSTLVVNLYKGTQYYISVCGKAKLGDIQLRISNAGDNRLIYDNAAYGFVDYIVITADVTQKLKIEVTAPSGKFTGTERECIGVYIASAKPDNKQKKN